MLSFCPTDLQYCSTVWHFCSARNRDELESLNKRALRVVFNDNVSSYQQFLYKSEGSNLYNRRIQNMLITIHKCLNCNGFPKYLKDMLPLRQSEYSFRKTNILSLCKPVTMYLLTEWEGRTGKYLARGHGVRTERSEVRAR